MLKPSPEIYYPPTTPPDFSADSPESARAASPYRPVPNRYMEPRLLPDTDYQLDDMLTEEAGMARNPGVLGAYAGSF